MSKNNPESIYQCPMLRDFSFKAKCPIKTCQHYSDQTIRRCMSLDRETGADKSFTDKELAYFKFGNRVNVREVSTKRRAGTSAIKNITALFLYVQYIDTNYKNNPIRIGEVGEDLDDLIGQSHLRHKCLAFKEWMLPYLLGHEVFSRFTRREGISSDVNFKTMLGLTTSDHKSFVAHVTELIKNASKR